MITREHNRIVMEYNSIVRECNSIARECHSIAREHNVSHDHSLRILFIAPITEHKYVLTGDGQKISAMA